MILHLFPFFKMQVDQEEQRKSDPASGGDSGIASALARALASRAKTVQGGMLTVAVFLIFYFNL